MEEDDESIKSEEKKKEIKVDAPMDCKKLNMELDDLEEGNGIIVINDGNLGRQIIMTESSNFGEESSSNNEVLNDNLENENISNDTAETIKKIREFIALGKCDDIKKDQQKKATPKKILIEKKSKKTVLENIKKANEDLDLERTLLGQDSTSDNSDFSEINKSPAGSHKEDNKEYDKTNKMNAEDSKMSDYLGKNIDATPSRTSKRIQSKSEKFSVKKLLRGDDTSVLKRMIPGYDGVTPRKKEKIAVKPIKHEVKKGLPTNKPLSPSSVSTLVDDETDTFVNTKKPEIKGKIVDLVEVNEDSESCGSSLSPIVGSSSPNVPVASPDTLTKTSSVSPSSTATEQKGVSSALAEKLGKFAVTNGKITLELQGSQQKKVVRIAVPPQKPNTSLQQSALGPDIIIKRVKPVKKSVAVPENTKLSSKTVIEKEIEQRPSVAYTPNIIKMSPHVNLEKLPVQKLKDDLVKIQKNIIRAGKLDDKITETSSASINRTEVDIVSEQNNETENSVKADIGNNVKKSTQKDPPSLTQQITEALENQTFKEDTAKRKLTEKIKPKKITKLSSSLEKNKSEVSIKKPPKLPIRKQELVTDKTPPDSDVDEPEVEHFETLFDKYFSTEERFIEHHDSLDSDSSNDFEDQIFSHFIDFKRRSEIKRDTEKDEDASLFDMMQDISVELPTWNIHASSSGEVFYLAKVDSVNDFPTMKKVVEMDLQYNAKVYVNGILLPQFKGNYSTYDDIRQLIYDVDQVNSEKYEL